MEEETVFVKKNVGKEKEIEYLDDDDIDDEVNNTATLYDMQDELEELLLTRDKLFEDISLLWKQIESFRSTGPNDYILSKCSRRDFYDFMAKNNPDLVRLNHLILTKSIQYNTECKANMDA